ncbi:hypothetical protein ACHAXM_008530 [Skeletonema potamos]
MVPPPNKRSKTSESSGETVVMQNRLLVPIAAKKNTELLELQPMTEEDLKLLQKKDPFLYYSIPEVREAALSLKEVDYSKISQSACKVSRKTRVSFERHTDFLLDELVCGDELEGLDASSDLCLGELSDILELLFKTQ